MKNTLIQMVGIAALTLSIAACGGKKDSVKTGDQKDVSQASDSSTSYEVDVTTSVLGWKGTKVGGAHNGTINLTSGTIAAEQNKITAGSFVIDMKTIKDLDMTEADGQKKLVDHLTSEDFFDVAKFPTSKFEITGTEALSQPDSAGNNYKIMGNLTIKDVTKNITIPANVTMDANNFSATAKFNIDRTEFGVKYKSGKFFPDIRDKAIGDIVEFDLTLKAVSKK